MATLKQLIGKLINKVKREEREEHVPLWVGQIWRHPDADNPFDENKSGLVVKIIDMQGGYVQFERQYTFMISGSRIDSLSVGHFKSCYPFLVKDSEERLELLKVFPPMQKQA